MLQSHFLLVSFQFCWSNRYVCCWSQDFSLSTTSFHRLTHKLNPKHLIPSVKSHSFLGDIGDITIFVGIRWTRSLLRCAMTSRQWRPIWRTPNRKVTRLRLSVIDCFSLFFNIFQPYVGWFVGMTLRWWVVLMSEDHQHFFGSYRSKQSNTTGRSMKKTWHIRTFPRVSNYTQENASLFSPERWKGGISHLFGTGMNRLNGSTLLFQS